MSRIYFHTPERTVEVRGSERAYMGQLASKIALAVIGPDGYQARERIEPFLRGAPDYLKPLDDKAWAQSFSTWFSVSWGDGGFEIDGKSVGAMDLALNTLIAMRSPAMTLVAKLHGTCEDWAFIDPEDAEWFAEIVEQGRAENVLRPDAGWEAVAELAREVASGLPGPIVTSYSVCEQFPNSGVASWQPPEDEDGEQDWDAWYALPDDEQWRLAEAGIRARTYNRQIAPATMDQGFMSGASAFDLNAAPVATPSL